MTSRVTLRGPTGPGYEEILTEEAVNFVAMLADAFRDRVTSALAAREQRQAEFAKGALPDFLPETAEIRSGDWTVAPLPADLLDRRVEITGPVDRKMVINALNSGASTFMADLEDSNAPSWSNCVEGQINLRDAVRGTITFDNAARGKRYELNEKTATLLVRPRGWHLVERHFELDGKAIPAGLFDFGLYFFHNAKTLIENGSGPYFYLPKLQSHLEARIWNDAFVLAQKTLGIPNGTIKATVLIETLPAAFELDEILWELKDHSSGLNCGRWDYIFSYIKTLRDHPDRVVPDRGQVGMTQPFMAAYSQRVIQVCHRRNVHAMGGMAAQIPIKNDPVQNEAALTKVRQDKLREVKDGHDGTWVAHPGLVSIAMDIFNEHMKTPNQIENKREDVHVTQADLVAVPTGTKTEAGLRQNVNVGLLYLEAWLGNSGCVPLYNLMEDAATAEISRTQLWQWQRHAVKLQDGRTVDRALIETTLDEELLKIREQLGAERYDGGHFDDAKRLFLEVSVGETCVEFLTLPAYEVLTSKTVG